MSPTWKNNFLINHWKEISIYASAASVVFYLGYNMSTYRCEAAATLKAAEKQTEFNVKIIELTKNCEDEKQRFYLSKLSEIQTVSTTISKPDTNGK